MDALSKKILIVGGGSRIAASLAPLLGPQANFVVRRPSGRPNEYLVDDYGAIPAAAFQAADCVINCVGVSTGNSAHLHRVNVDIPLQMATSARDAGARRFIHISSFSVYGCARLIDAKTMVAPTSAYGTSKLAGDNGLGALGTDRFAMILLRLPLIYGRDTLGKLGQLLRLWARLRALPVPGADVTRAMIGAELTAEVIARLCTDAVDGIVLAADPMPFKYAQAAAARPEKLVRLPIPAAITGAISKVAPALGQRLFADSRLADSANLAISYGLRSRLYSDIAAADLNSY